jgi:hypothetical protein
LKSHLWEMTNDESRMTSRAILDFRHETLVIFARHDDRLGPAHILDRACR